MLYSTETKKQRRTEIKNIPKCPPKAKGVRTSEIFCHKSIPPPFYFLVVYLRLVSCIKMFSNRSYIILKEEQPLIFHIYLIHMYIYSRYMFIATCQSRILVTLFTNICKIFKKSRTYKHKCDATCQKRGSFC